MGNKKFQNILKKVKNGTYKSYKIYLHDCQITDQDWKELKKAILNNNVLSKNLKGLELSNNELTSIDLTKFSNLEILELSNNKLTSIVVTGLSKLKMLFLPNNKLTSIDITGLSNLKELYLDNNKITSLIGTGISSIDAVYIPINTTILFKLMLTKTIFCKKLIPTDTISYKEVYKQLQTREINTTDNIHLKWHSMLLELMKITIIKIKQKIKHNQWTLYQYFLSFFASEILKFIFSSSTPKNKLDPIKKLILKDNNKSLLQNCSKELKEYKNNNQPLVNLLTKRMFILYIKALKTYTIDKDNIKTLIDEHVNKVLNLEIKASKIKLLNLFKNLMLINLLHEKKKVTTTQKNNHSIHAIFNYIYNKNMSLFANNFIEVIVKLECKIYLRHRLRLEEQNMQKMFSQCYPKLSSLISSSKKFKNIIKSKTGKCYDWLNFNKEYKDKIEDTVKKFYSNLLNYAKGEGTGKEQSFKNVLGRIYKKCEELSTQEPTQEYTQSQITAVPTSSRKKMRI